jgi:hypothetical protein
MRRRPSPTALALALAIVLPWSLALAPAHAGDNTQGLPAGGLLFVPDDRIVVEAQEIVLGRASIRVTYAVRNKADVPLMRAVAFPMPTIDMEVLGDNVVVLPAGDPRNFTAAAVAADGQPISLAFEQRARAFTRDITELLGSLGLPVNPMSGGIEAALKQLAPEQFAQLEERGAVRNEHPRLLPNWTLLTTAHWRQTFLPEKLATIGLAYAPVTASGLWGPDSLAELKAGYCIDSDLEAAILAKSAKAGRALATHRITYSVTSEPGWWVPIPNFRLAIEKPGFETLVATCHKDLRLVGPTLVEWIGKDWRPQDDIRVLFID